MSDSFYITTPIYYVNDVPHIGHAYTTVAADAAVRYHRLAGDASYLLTGTDEHGEKIERAAREHGMSAKQWTDSMIPPWKEVWANLDISYDDFIRTTEERHEGPVQDFVQALYDKDEVYLGTYEGLYCVGCEQFKTPDDLVDGRCPLHPNRDIEHVKEDNYFFRLSKYAQPLLDLLGKNPDFFVARSNTAATIAIAARMPNRQPRRIHGRVTCARAATEAPATLRDLRSGSCTR